MTPINYLVHRQRKIQAERGANETRIADLYKQIRELEQENVFKGFEIVQLNNIIRNMAEKGP